MNTPLIDQNPSSDREPSHDTTHQRPMPKRIDFGRGRTWLLVGAAAAVVALGTAAIMQNDGGNEIAAGPPLELSLPGSDVMASCMPLDVQVLSTMSPAFAATVTAVDANGTISTVTLDVDRWYTGGDAETVVLQSQSGLEALIDGFDFAVGERYLITAAGGAVNFCGFSGLATPELTALFDQAFAA